MQVFDTFNTSIYSRLPITRTFEDRRRSKKDRKKFELSGAFSLVGSSNYQKFEANNRT